MNRSFEQVGRLLRTDQAGRLVALVERLEVLAQVGLRVAAADLLDLRRDVAEEMALDGFPQVPGRMLGHVLAHLGDVQQLLHPLGVRLLRRHLAGQLGIAVRQPDDRPHRDEAGLVEVELGGVRQPHVEGLLPLLDLLDHAGEALVVDPRVVQVAAAARPGHELRDEARLVDGVRIEAVLLDEDLVGPRPQRPLVPVLERPLVRLPVFRGLRLLDGLLFLHPLHVPFRIRVDGVDAARHAADDEVLVDVQLLPLDQLGEELGPADDLLVAGGALVDLRHDPDPLAVDLLGRAHVLLLQPVDPIGIDLDPTAGIPCHSCRGHRPLSCFLMWCGDWCSLRSVSVRASRRVTPPGAIAPACRPRCSSP